MAANMMSISAESIGMACLTVRVNATIPMEVKRSAPGTAKERPPAIFSLLNLTAFFTKVRCAPVFSMGLAGNTHT